MNFAHSIDILMAGSGINEVLTGAFGSVHKICSVRKNIPKTFEQCVCWLKRCYDL